MSLRQIQVRYDAHEDRLLVRFSTQDNIEHRFWLTRRLLSRLWPGLVQRMQSTELARQQAAPETRQAVVELQRAQALEQTQFGQPFEEAELKPALPGETMVVATVRLAAVPPSGHELVFLPQQGPGVQIRFTDQLLHAFSKLLQDALKISEWGLVLDMPAAPVVQGEKRRLN